MNPVKTISIEEMENILLETPTPHKMNRDEARRFLMATKSSLSYEISDYFPSEKIIIKPNKEQPFLTLGIIPEENLLERISLCTGLPHKEVKDYLTVLDTEIFRPNITPEKISSQPLNVECFGTFSVADNKLTYKTLPRKPTKQ